MGKKSKKELVGDATKGAKIFKQKCAQCHTYAADGTNKTGFNKLCFIENSTNLKLDTRNNQVIFVHCFRFLSYFLFFLNQSYILKFRKSKVSRIYSK